MPLQLEVLGVGGEQRFPEGLRRAKCLDGALTESISRVICPTRK